MAIRFEEELNTEDPPRQEFESPYATWELQKENIQPVSQGRNIETLMKALTMTTDMKSRKELFDKRKEQFDQDVKEAIDDENKQLNLWYDYIEWLEQNVPDGGKVNGVTNAIEQCIEYFYNKKTFKQDERLFDIFMKFKRFCDEPAEIFGFMYANSIGTLLSRFYLNWSWQYEMKKNVRRAEDLLKLGLKNLATPRDVLIEAETQLKFRVQRMIQLGQLDHQPEVSSMNMREMQARLQNEGIRAALQTLKFKVTKQHGSTVSAVRVGSTIEQGNVGGLKSQTEVVNGVERPKKINVTKRTKKAVPVFTDENGPSPTDDVSNMIKKIPTSQRIQLVGNNRGSENQVPRTGSLVASARPANRP